jgi:hypothetical protein
VVEGKFSELKNIDQFEFLPGRHIKFPKRRDPDGKKRAVLNMDELTKIVVIYILELNKRPPEFTPYDLDFENTGRLTRSDLFKWGLEHRTGYTQEKSPGWVVRNLMKADRASVTEKGIEFKQNKYKSARLSELGYFERARTNGCFEITVFYDENRAWEIYTFTENDELIIANNKREEIKDNSATFFEVHNYKKDKKYLDKRTKRETAQDTHEGRLMVDDIVKKATKEPKEGEGGSHSKAQKKANIRKHRELEKRDIFPPGTNKAQNDNEDSEQNAIAAEADDMVADFAFEKFKISLT